MNSRPKKLLLFCGIFYLSIVNSYKFYGNGDCKNEPLDKKMAEILNFKKNGVFIEVGANDGISQSNTKFFEESLGWVGILVEPSPYIFEKLKKNRPHSRCFQCALGNFEENETIQKGDFDGSLMGSFTNRLGEKRKKIKTQIRSLQSILDECKINHVHFFSLDTEGYEFNILKGIDFNKTTFDYILIEIYTHQYEKIVSFLKEKGYELTTCLSKYNHKQNPNWDGTHNDYLFSNKNKNIIANRQNCNLENFTPLHF